MVDHPALPLRIRRGRDLVDDRIDAGGIRSTASDLPSIIMEMQASRTSEREGRLIDSDSVGSMEKKKQEGYF